jgi:uncharacterized membrane protein (DUF373 family)
MPRQLPRNLGEIRREWSVLTFHQRFEASVALLLTLLVKLVIVVALIRLTASVVETLVLRSLNPLEHAVFQRVFGEIMTVLIALEFNHTLRYVIARESGIVQAQAVILIAQLAVARKVIVTEFYDVPPASVAATAGLVLALGITYWLIRERDAREPE